MLTMHNPESVLKNETHKPLWDFEIQTEHLISARQQDFVIAKKKRENRPNGGVYCTSEPQSKNKRKQNKKLVLRPYQTTKKKLWNTKVTMIPIVIGVPEIIPKGFVNRLEDLEIRRKLETIRNTGLLRSVRILRGVLETWGNLLILKH